MKMVLGIYGTGGLAREVYIIAKKILNKVHRWEDIVFIDDINDITELEGRKVYRFFTAIKSFSDFELSIAVGEPALRDEIYSLAHNNQVKLATLIHPGVYIDESTKIGDGVIICDMATITSHVVISDNVYLQPHVVIGHDIFIGRHSVIGANCQIGGANHIGERVYMGFNSGTKENLTIGKDVICSAGAIVFRDIPDEVIVVGNPARIMKKNEDKKVFRKKETI